MMQATINYKKRVFIYMYVRREKVIRYTFRPVCMFACFLNIGENMKLNVYSRDFLLLFYFQ